MRPPGLWGQDGRALWPVLALAAGGMAASAAWSLWPSASGSLADPDPEQVALGRSVYADHCAACHGAELEGQPDWQTRNADGRMPAPPHDASGHTWHHAEEQLFWIVKRGIELYASPGYRSDMPAFAATLSDEEIWAVLAYIKSSWPERERAFHEQVSRNAREGE